MKRCNSCKLKKDKSDFYSGKGKCKVCIIQMRKDSYDKDSKQEYNAKYRQKNQQKISEAGQQYYLKNKDKIKDYKRKYVKSNKDKIAANSKRYWLDNKSRLMQENNTYIKNREAVDPLFKLTRRLRSLVYHALKRGEYKKTSRAETILGADFRTVQQHLEQSAIRFYGFYCASVKYDIDHIIPCASAKTEEELIKLQHYTNLQLLYPIDNLKKGSK